MARSLTSTLLLLALLVPGLVCAQSVYKYRGENGEWIYTDRPPQQGAKAEVEVRTLNTRSRKPTFTVTHEVAGNSIHLVARNNFFAPMEVALYFDDIRGVGYPDPDADLRWVVMPRSEKRLLSLPVLGDVDAPAVSYRFSYLPGDPGAIHRARDGYRAPFSAGSNYPITQAFPDQVTHQSPDSLHAIDFAMPIGTDVLAARGGVVFEIAANNFKSGFNRAEYAHAANYVRILHDDGTFAVYAHLNRNSIRVRPGDRVVAGQYIADSGNTGFSSGPHLHFAVQRNSGMNIESVPVVFRGPSTTAVMPATGDVMTAYH